MAALSLSRLQSWKKHSLMKDHDLSLDPNSVTHFCYLVEIILSYIINLLTLEYERIHIFINIVRTVKIDINHQLSPFLDRQHVITLCFAMLYFPLPHLLTSLMSSPPSLQIDMTQRNSSSGEMHRQSSDFLISDTHKKM